MAYCCGFKHQGNIFVKSYSRFAPNIKLKKGKSRVDMQKKEKKKKKIILSGLLFHRYVGVHVINVERFIRDKILLHKMSFCYCSYLSFTQPAQMPSLKW